MGFERNDFAKSTPSRRLVYRDSDGDEIQIAEHRRKVSFYCIDGQDGESAVAEISKGAELQTVIDALTKANRDA